jgi:hypothetical protein
MPAEKKPSLELRIRSKQHSDISADLIAQTVMILGRELAAETKPGEDLPEK